MEWTSSLFSLWSSSILLLHLLTLLVNISGIGWDPLEDVYLWLVRAVQNVCERREWRRERGGQKSEKSLADAVGEWKASGEGPTELSLSFLHYGIAAIVQDDISSSFCAASTAETTLLHLPSISDGALTLLLYSFSFLFRWLFLFPLRLSLFISSLVWVIATGCFSLYVPNVSARRKLYFGKTFARLFNAGTGMIVRTSDTQNRPSGAGIAVANHLSANDIMTIYSDAHSIGYTCTGQIHGGVLYPISMMGGALTPLLLMDRSKSTDRAVFQAETLEYARKEGNYPILLFPEGFCVNNHRVMQFRKGLFSHDVNIFPVVLTQQARYGDAFWLEDTFVPYLLRLFSSWAQVVHIQYLPAMRMEEGESSAAFAKRVQKAMAEAARLPHSCYDGGLKRKKEREAYQEKLKKTVGEELSRLHDSLPTSPVSPTTFTPPFFLQHNTQHLIECVAN